MNLNPLKGFRDYMPEEMEKRRWIIEKLRQVFEKYGFEEIDTPAIERLEILEGKYGEDEKLIWKFQDLGGRWVALRYDQTVPLARVFSRFKPARPFRRYAIGKVWRYENPQRGRLREFLQADADIVGLASEVADAEIIALAYEGIRELGLDAEIRVNDRAFMDSLLDSLGVSNRIEALRAIDKLDKIGIEGVREELARRKVENPDAVVEAIQESKEPPENLSRIMELAREMGAKVRFDISLVRGLDYYTGMVMEIEGKNGIGSLGGGGRYDNLMGIFGESAEAVGMSFGVERIFELVNPSIKKKTVLVCSISSPKYLAKTLKKLREVYSVSWISGKKLGKQLEYASKKGFRRVVIIGPAEEERSVIKWKDMETGEEWEEEI